MGTLYDKSGKEITWLEAIIQSMKIIGEPSRIEDIYDVMVQKAGIKVPDTAKTPTQTIYGQIYSHSKDSKAGRNAKESLFLKKESGVWGLVEQYFVDPELDMLVCEVDSAEVMLYK